MPIFVKEALRGKSMVKAYLRKAPNLKRARSVVIRQGIKKTFDHVRAQFGTANRERTTLIKMARERAFNRRQY